MNQDFGIDEESRTIRVAILDTGLDSLHSRFRKHPRVADYKSFTEDGYADRDPVGHGTHIAGIILDLAPNVDLYIAQIADSKSFDSHRQIVMVSPSCITHAVKITAFDDAERLPIHRHYDGRGRSGKST